MLSRVSRFRDELQRRGARVSSVVWRLDEESAESVQSEREDEWEESNQLAREGGRSFGPANARS